MELRSLYVFSSFERVSSYIGQVIVMPEMVAVAPETNEVLSKVKSPPLPEVVTLPSKITELFLSVILK
jgi:hypothetical protein